ncbi:hypothetical protein DDP54_01345 [Cellulomonas sp. WB94]|uniref:hypothetical protein n=1 Tax=Cellulomonas sp. WB94 TaxID=2173174 RepID=UPI000D5693D6|nr:hypothetical protein [Cellulomonas sp. WB94]PVU81890.1 hypothetical protein DDP54_01345 [Cellulomonas sp. WB94]
MNLVDALGWAGSALLVYSVLQSRMLRLRVLNLAASLALVAFNAIIGVWPMVAMNAALCLINGWFAVSLVRQRNRGSAFDWVGAGPDDPFVRRFLTQHGDDVAEFFPVARDLPAALATVSAADTLCALVLHGDVTVGLVVATADDSAPGGTWRLLIDYVIPGYRDYTAGSFIYSPAGPFAARGAGRVVAGPELAPVRTYLGHAGFDPAERGWARALQA